MVQIFCLGDKHTSLLHHCINDIIEEIYGKGLSDKLACSSLSDILGLVKYTSLLPKIMYKWQTH